MPRYNWFLLLSFPAHLAFDLRAVDSRTLFTFSGTVVVQISKANFDLKKKNDIPIPQPLRNADTGKGVWEHIREERLTGGTLNTWDKRESERFAIGRHTEAQGTGPTA